MFGNAGKVVGIGIEIWGREGTDKKGSGYHGFERKVATD